MEEDIVGNIGLPPFPSSIAIYKDNVPWCIVESKIVEHLVSKLQQALCNFFKGTKTSDKIHA